MVELNKLSPAALATAMKHGTRAWGQHGSAVEHKVYVDRAKFPKGRWRMCRCGCKKRVTHIAAANGIALNSGCELSMRRWVKFIEDKKHGQ